MPGICILGAAQLFVVNFFFPKSPEDIAEMQAKKQERLRQMQIRNQSPDYSIGQAFRDILPKPKGRDTNERGQDGFNKEEFDKDEFDKDR